MIYLYIYQLYRQTDLQFYVFFHKELRYWYILRDTISNNLLIVNFEEKYLNDHFTYESITKKYGFKNVEFCWSDRRASFWKIARNYYLKIITWLNFVLPLVIKEIYQIDETKVEDKLSLQTARIKSLCHKSNR